MNVIIDYDIYYEIGYFINDKNEKYKHLIIWRRENKAFVRELDMISKSDVTNTDFEGIDAARDEWNDLCSSHNASDLVNSLYTENAIYYNDGALFVGRTAITSRYSVIESPSVSFIITPIICEPVKNNIYFEIGQGSGAYNGKYAIIWKKINSNWEILLDSND